MLIDLLKKRCSVRSFTDQPVSEDIISYILEAGRLSPSGGNEQSWMFGVVTDKPLITELAKCAYNQTWIATAPLIIVLVTVIVDDERDGRYIHKSRFPHQKRQVEEMDKTLYANLLMEEHQTKIPGTHMVLAALEHGIYSTWISYFEVSKVNKLLGLPKFKIASEMIAFGYPALDPKQHLKKPMEQLMFRNTFSKQKT